MTDLLRHVLRHGDRALVLAQRLGQWITHSPELEQDMAFANISLDLIGQARYLYTYAGEQEGQGHDEDHFAYWRGPTEFYNPLIVEQPNGDFAQTIARQFLHDCYALAYWQAMTGSADATLAGLAERARSETAFHLRHARSWLVRLGTGTEESHARMQNGLDAMWCYTDELGPISDEADLRAVGLVRDGDLRAVWEAAVKTGLAEASLVRPDVEVAHSGGWQGDHSEHLDELLEELQSVARAHRGAKW